MLHPQHILNVKCSAILTIFVFLIIATLVFTVIGETEERGSKDICRKKPFSPLCWIKRSEKPLNVFDTLSFFFGNKKKKKRRKDEITSESSVRANAVSYGRNHRNSSTFSRVTAHGPDSVSKYRRVMKNMHNLENDACGISLVPRILGGENTLPGEFPWLARLLYKNKITGKRNYGCGGSLISSKYILTAAHCLKRYGLKLQSVRLGEYNTKMYAMDCSDNGISINDFIEMDTCEPARDYEVESHHVHEHYKHGQNLAHDIGLILLRKSVFYTRYIMPVCLPVGRYKVNGNFGSDLMAVGWGMTEMSEGSEIPLKARTPWMEMEACKPLIGRDLTPGQLCVGGADGGSTCHGDSGGPLVLTTDFSERDNSVEEYLYSEENRTILVGIISGGNRVCSIEPTLFVNVESYLWWILLNIKT